MGLVGLDRRHLLLNGSTSHPAMMIPNGSTSQLGPPNWTSNSTYCSESWTSSPFSVSSLSDGRCQLGEFYEIGPGPVSNTASNTQGQPLDASMCEVAPAPPWLQYPGMMGYREVSHCVQPGHQYHYGIDSVEHDCGTSTPDSPSYTYHLSNDFSGVDSTLSRPRSYANDMIPASVLTKETGLSGYPPCSFVLDSQKQEADTASTRQRDLRPVVFAERLQQSLASLCLEPEERSSEPQGLIPPLSPMPSQLEAPNHSHTTESSMLSSCPPTGPPSGPPSGLPSGTPDLLESARNEETEIEDNEPYAKLIYRALLSAPGHRMVLKEIYDWFSEHTDKNKNPSPKGWQNSIRHNLSMNGVSQTFLSSLGLMSDSVQAFRKIEQDPTEDGKRGFAWFLEPSAVIEGVKSTTRYRKAGVGKRYSKSDNFVLQRRHSAGKKTFKASKRVRGTRRDRPVTPATPSSIMDCTILDNVASNISINDRTMMDLGENEKEPCLQQYHSLLPLKSVPRSYEGPDSAHQASSDSVRSTPVKLEPSYHYDLIGVTENFEGDVFFYDDREDPMTTGSCRIEMP